MKYTVYQSIVSKMGTIMPLFGKALVDMALKRRGHTAETISPVEMLELIKTDINPRLANRLHAVGTVLNAGAGVAQTDEQDRVVYANSVVRRMTLASDFASPSAHLFALLRAQGFIRSVHEIASLEIHEFHSTTMGKDFSVILYPVRDPAGRVCGVVSIIEDVTIREAIDAEMIKEVRERRRAEADLHNVIQCIADPILVVDRAGVVVRANPAAQHLCAVASESQLIGARAEALLQPSAPLADGLMRGLEARTELHDVDAMLLPVGQRPIPILLSAAVLRDELATMTGAVFSAKDMRQQRALLAKLLSTSKLAALGEMAGGIAHEINSPLTVIQGRAGQIGRLVAQAQFDPATVRAFAEKIESTSRRIARIVRGLLAFARQGDQDRVQPTLIRAIVDEALELCRERFTAHGVDLRTGPMDETASVPCRQTQIGQVLLNLLSNAFDAVDQASEKWIALSVRTRDDQVEIAVEDSGPGIPPELRERIFQPFFTTKPVGKGTGLGLSISHGIVQEHGGSLVFDERSPHTRFVVSLPR